MIFTRIIAAILVANFLFIPTVQAYKKHKVVGPAYGKVSSPFGSRIDPFTKELKFHSGVDIAAKSGTPIFALQEGVVTFSGWLAGYGKVVIIDHFYSDVPKIPRVQTKYAHNSKNIVKVGDRIQRGDVVAYIGSTGRSTGPHLHFEVIYKGNAINPMDYLQKLPKYLDYVAYTRKQNNYTSYAFK